MDVETKLDSLIRILENTQCIKDASQFIQQLKPSLRQQTKNSFVKVNFDKSDCQGAVFIRFVKKPHTQISSSKCVEEADLKFIISIEGFNSEGTVTEDAYNEFKVSMLEYKCKEGVTVPKLKEKTLTNLRSVKSYIESYFKNNQDNLSLKEDGAVALAGGTASANIATVAPKLGAPMLKPPIPNKKKKNKIGG